MSLGKRLLDVDASFSTYLPVLWLTMLAMHYSNIAEHLGFSAATLAPMVYVCGGTLAVPATYVPPFVVALVMAFVGIGVFHRWGVWQRKYFKTSRKGGSVNAAAFLMAALWLGFGGALNCEFIPSHSEPKRWDVLLTMARLNFPVYAGSSSFCLVGFFYSAVIWLRKKEPAFGVQFR
ncbi:hypothetical protein [Pseudomonas turukhanskensis]|uniref:Uncharacterized protein n=1 Tax=Pseudomonas turukhanskensis TaxID=1806536 RepID=A0A9W6K6Y6_9PSED|nr:hypothetical protein [Pseudomonas turukhanskensis]GLK89373.1 hypothetical protein GCM10017655_24350 [Pseudomonas turukhanskensis]